MWPTETTRRPAEKAKELIVGTPIDHELRVYKALKAARDAYEVVESDGAFDYLTVEEAKAALRVRVAALYRAQEDQVAHIALTDPAAAARLAASYADAKVLDEKAEQSGVVNNR